jgi:hypothetical protein
VGGPLREKQAVIALDERTDDRNGGGDWHGRLLNKEAADSATFLKVPCFSLMKTFLKILLVVAILFIAIKLSPVVFVAVLVGLLVAAMLGAIGLSLVAGLVAVALALVAALAPIWIPVLLIVGLVSLFKKFNGRSEPPVMVL